MKSFSLQPMRKFQAFTVSLQWPLTELIVSSQWSKRIAAQMQLIIYSIAA